MWAHVLVSQGLSDSKQPLCSFWEKQKATTFVTQAFLSHFRSTGPLDNLTMQFPTMEILTLENESNGQNDCNNIS